MSNRKKPKTQAEKDIRRRKTSENKARKLRKHLEKYSNEGNRERIEEKISRYNRGEVIKKT